VFLTLEALTPQVATELLLPQRPCGVFQCFGEACDGFMGTASLVWFLPSDVKLGITRSRTIQMKI
jgi:hypothetical protein